MTTRLSVSVTIAGLSRIFGSDLHGVLEAARIADAVGIDQLVLPDHLAIGRQPERYPYGRFPFSNQEPWLEPLTTLAAMAGATRRIRLGTGVLIAPLRPALLLAKTLATLDVLSQGRLDLGVGIGWQPEEFEASGVPFAGRMGRMLDTLRACRTLWTEAPASFHSKTVDFEDLWCLPRPVQHGGPPLWFGMALNERNAARIAELGTGWMPVEASLPEISQGAEILGLAFMAAGRGATPPGIRAGIPAVLDRQGRTDLDATLATLPRFQEAGATVAAFALGRFVASEEQVRPFLEKLGRMAR